MSRPKVLITPWRRDLKNFFGGTTDIVTIDSAYTDAVRRAGGLPLIAPHLEADEVAELLDTVDAVVLSGGPDMDPDLYGADNTSSFKVKTQQDEFDLEVARGAIDRRLSILGICRGLQVINVALGGDLRQEVQAEGDGDHPTYTEMGEGAGRHRHDVEIAEGSRLATLYGSGRQSVNSLHHQAVGRVGDGLDVVAKTADGTVEAIEALALDVVAVQWHPEMIPSEGGDALFGDLVDRARLRTAVTS